MWYTISVSHQDNKLDLSLSLLHTMVTVLGLAILLLTLAPTLNALDKDCFEGGGSISLQVNIYFGTCPPAEDIISSVVQRAVSGDPRMAASLLRLHFHDCFVNGCDASVLLDDVPPVFFGEKTAAPNVNSLRGFDVIDEIKAELELACPETVSCADILAVAARDSVVVSGGPSWEVELGRMDSLTASNNTANNNIPGPNSNIPTLVQKFQNLGLSQKDMVALSGAHTIGKARCATFNGRLSVSDGSNAGEMEFLQSLQQLCSDSNGTLAHLDLATPSTFDNQYYINLLSGEGLLPSDQVLVGGEDGGVASLVEAYASDVLTFYEDFTTSILNMGRLAPPAGARGEVRRSCRSVNN